MGSCRSFAIFVECLKILVCVAEVLNFSLENSCSADIGAINLCIMYEFMMRMKCMMMHDYDAMQDDAYDDDL